MTKTRSVTNKARAARWGKRVLIALGAAVALLLALWVAIHRIPGLGPWLADAGRVVLGVDNVARLEAFAYSVQDRVLRVVRRGSAPEAHWELPPSADAGAPVVAVDVDAAPTADAAPTRPPWRPADVGRVSARFGTEVDGVWVPVGDPRRPEARPLLYKTQLHPDSSRPWAVVFVVAMEVSAVELHLVTGTVDPRPATQEGRKTKRSGLVAPEHRGSLVAAFNGGFKAEHGQYGLRTGSVTFVPPRAISCTVAGYEDGSLRVGVWKALEATQERMRFWRGTPPCLLDAGKRHAALWDEESRGWGAALGGETVIRRSALGVSAAGDVVFVALGDHTTARALADAVAHAGARDAAQLDVNYSFPRFVLFREVDGALEAETLFKGFVFEKTDYVERPSPRDFFYITRREG